MESGGDGFFSIFFSFKAGELIKRDLVAEALSDGPDFLFVVIYLFPYLYFIFFGSSDDSHHRVKH